MALGRLLNLDQIVAGMRQGQAARVRVPGGVSVSPPAHPASPAAAPPPHAASPVAPPPAHAATPIAPPPQTPSPAAPAPTRQPSPPPGISAAALRVNPALIAQLEGRSLRPRLDGLRPGLLPGGASAGFLRAESSHPISPVAAPDDRCLYEDPHDPQRRYWLPRVRLRESGGRYEIKLAQGQDGLWAVSLALETYPAPEIAEAARSASPLPFQRSAAIAYRAPGTSIEQRLPVTDIQDDPRGGCLAMLRLGLSDRDSLLRAFMSADAQCRLVFARAYTVAVPRPMAEAPDRPKRQLMMVKGRMQLAPAASVALKADLSASAAVSLAKPAPSLSKPGLHAATPAMRASLMRRIDDEPIFRPDDAPLPRRPLPRPFPRPRPQPWPQPQPQPQPQPEPPAQEQEQRYELSSPSQDCAVALLFEPQLHPYLYPAGSGTAQAPRWTVHSLRHPAGNGRTHAYFQDLNDPSRIYYLPDAFKLARRGEAPHAPALVFQVDQGEDAEQAMVDLTCEVRPVTDGERLLAARRELAGTVPASADNPNRDFELRLLRAASSLQLNLVRNGAVRAQTVPATIDWDNGFTINERFGFQDFQDVFGALMAVGGNTHLLQGAVVVASGVDANVMVPVRLDFADMEGELFQSVETADPQTGAVAVKLVNATESPLRIPRLPVWITRGEGLVEARIEGLDLSQPVEVAPGQALEFVAQPSVAPPGAAPADAIFNTTAVRALPDGEAILKYTLDDRIDQQTVRPVTVMCAESFLANQDGEGGPIDTIVVEFRGNRRVVIDAEHLSVDVEIPVSLMDILLRKDSEGRYEYRKSVVYASGRVATDAKWRSDDTGVLFVTAA